jgi:hypothetical protein
MDESAFKANREKNGVKQWFRVREAVDVLRAVAAALARRPYPQNQNEQDDRILW